MVEQRRPGAAAVIGAVSLGGGIGALARYSLTGWFPADAGGFPWGTVAVNVTGCALIGVLMVLATDVWHRQRLLRPFLGVGVLGGYTTFSAPMWEALALSAGGAAGRAALYLAATAVAALAAAAAGVVITRRVVRYARARGGS